MKITGFDTYKTRFGIESRSVIEPGLERIERVLAALGHPERHDKIIHVAGTNGKGSTIAFLKALCETHNLTYGAFQSPAIVDVHDQIVVNGTPISEHEMNSIVEKVSKVEEAKTLTDFELLTVCAFLFFQQKEVEMWLVETGMGGRFDSTNVVSNSTAVITSLSIDHTNFLGTTLDDIGSHKAGIIKQKANVFVPESIYLAPIEKEVEAKNALLNMIAPLGEEIEIALLGEHQRMNASLAVAAFQSLVDSNPGAIEQALKTAYIPFRMEKIAENVYLDGAHNLESAVKLAETIKKSFKGQSIHLIMGILADKEYKEVLKALEEVADKITFVEFSHERALDANRLVELCRIENYDLKKVEDIVINLTNDGKTSTFLTGSLYFLTEWRFKNSQ
ncbi:bifunctional folylpolyglutamate synthase/dihydrofolate synthase [Chryseomicrobium aureum]|uniref:bifunctional folylpolyglutamate synthase/dihydrofolate synthase n=1 Tax=Chryseomicrobium aureum TaxID=1441723 RepID=UPI00370DACCD